jgi:hypothetical protein
MNLTLEAIQFNHDKASATADALTIRKNESEPGTDPEWQRGISFEAKDSKAAYAIAQTRGHTISIKVKFKTKDLDLSNIEVQAVDANTPASGGNVLGEVRKATVKFRRDGESDDIAFELQNVRLADRGVGITKIVWRWQFRKSESQDWKDFAKTAHLIYTVLDIPQGPWSQESLAGDNTQLPWTEVLEVACDWAAGARNVDEAAALIARNVYDLGLDLVTYQGSPSSYGGVTFDCTNFLKVLRGQVGIGKTFNCSDCATIVSSLANILGCQTFEVNLFPPFLTNPIIVLSGNTPKPEDFSAHEIALKGDTPEEGTVFDGCLRVDGDDCPSDPRNFLPLLPTNMRFGSASDQLYRFRLSSRNNVEPSLNQRHRRGVGIKVPGRFVDLDPRFLEFLEKRYDYDSWRNLPPSRNFEPPTLPVIEAGRFPDLIQVNQQSQKLVDGTRLRQFLWQPIKKGSDVLLGEDLFECADWHAARALLLRLLGEYRSTAVKRLKETDFADILFLADDNASLLFAYCEWVGLIRSAGKEQISLQQAGLALPGLLLAQTDTCV